MTQAPPGWDAIADAYDDVVTPMSMAFADTLLDRVDIGAGTELLDVAAGSGALAIPAARRGADVVAIDLSSELVTRLRARSDGLSIDAHVMDAQRLLFDEATFDISASQFGINLVPDLDRAFAELARVTRRGGRALIASFGPDVGFLRAFIGAMVQTVDGFTPPDMRDAPPARLADADHFRDALVTAGFTDIVVEQSSWDMALRSGAHVWDLVMASNPMGAVLVANLDTAARAAVKAAMNETVRAADGVLTTAVNVATARR